MAEYDFIPPEVYDTLPDDPGEQFLLLTETAEKIFRDRHASATGAKADAQRKSYIGQLNAISQELGFGPLPLPQPGMVTDGEWSAFHGGLTAVKTRIRLRLRKSHAALVPFNYITKAHIEQEIERLRNIIKSSNLTDSKKTALNEKLDELEKELGRQKPNFVKLVTVIAAIAATIGGSTATLADGPEAFETVGRMLRWVGEAKLQEESHQQKALPKPTKRLPAPNGDERTNEDQDA